VCADDGELYTWGKAGPHLGYEAKAAKQTSPHKVDLHGNKIKMVACGVSHTLGEQISLEQSMWESDTSRRNLQVPGLK